MSKQYMITVVVLLLLCLSETALAGRLVARTGPTDSVVESVWVSMQIRAPEPEAMGDALGLGLVLIDPDRGALGEGFAWDEPNAPYSISVGFDVHNPAPDKSADEKGRVMGWFDADGNWYDRPQREVSVHADGREIINTRSEYEFRSNRWVDVDVNLRYELGGARILVLLDGHTVVDDELLGVKPMRLHAMAGVEGEGLEVRDLAITRVTPLDNAFAEPVRVNVFDSALLQNAARLKSEADFSGIPGSVGRVIATFTLGEPEMGYDHWDKKGTIGITVPTDPGSSDDVQDGDSQRFEVFRFITPFRRGWTWTMDVTDLLPLFKDHRVFDAHIGTYMKGWLVSFDLDFYPGAPERTPIKVVKLWSGDAEIGNPDNPVEEFYKPITVGVPESAHSARVRMTVTGHGMLPNSNNAGEFMPIWRTLTMKTDPGSGDVLEGDFISMSARDHLWKTDVYLNPCRPQGGTWKFDRSGWAPGSKVEPWKVDTQSEFVFGDQLTIEYTLDEYINEGRGETWAPHHWTDAVVVFYK